MVDQTIMTGDCLENMAQLSDNMIDIVCTSPPYNLDIAYNSYEDRKPRDQYLLWIRDVAIMIKRIMKPNGSLFLNIGSSNTDPWISHDVASIFRDYYVLQNHIIWVKSISFDDDTVGHFKPINSKRFLNHNHESIYHFSKLGDVKIDRLAVGVPFKDKTNIARRQHMQDKRCAGNIWLIPYETVRSKTQKFDHPAGYPVELAMRCIKLHGVTPETVVLDPFAGVGTTLLAATRLNCRSIGIEIDPLYSSKIITRLGHNMESYLHKDVLAII